VRASYRFPDFPGVERDSAITASVSATDTVTQSDDAVAEPALVKQFQVQPHTVREEPFSPPTTAGQTNI
jgi:hypothetical protein